MARTFNTKKFIKSIFNGKYALVIGNENILNKDIEKTGDVHQYFLRKVNNHYNSQYDDYWDIALEKTEKINPIRQLISNGEISFQVNHISKELFHLLETRLFTTVLTTTTDGYVEAAMRQIWGRRLRVVNFYDKETIDELQNILKQCRRGKKYNEPTLIYVFGKLDVEDITKRYIKTDAEAIQLIEQWMLLDKANNEFINYIRDKRLLTLGCKFDNWYFRFFWYILTGVIKSCEENNFDGKGEVLFSIDEDDKSEKQLLQFLNRTDICVLGDANTFIRKLTEILTNDSFDAPFRKQIIEARRSGGIFISYCSKDAIAASQLFFQLCDLKMDVWIDSARLYGGEDYEEKIYDAINAAKVVITILSPNIADDLISESTDHYYNKEWRMAQQFNDKVIIPLAINGYSLRAQYHQNYENIVVQKPSGIDLMEADGFAKLINSLNEHC